MIFVRRTVLNSAYNSASETTQSAFGTLGLNKPGSALGLVPELTQVYLTRTCQMQTMLFLKQNYMLNSELFV